MSTGDEEDVVLRIAPKEIDRADVLGELRHLFWGDDPNDALGWALDKLAELEIVRFREPVDDPVRDLVGARRDMSTPEDDKAGVNHAEIGNWAVRWTSNHFSGRPWVWFRWDGPQLLSNETVAGRPLIEPLSGTPAAEAQAGPRPIPEWEMDILRKEAQKPQPIDLHKAADPHDHAVHTGLKEHCTLASCLPREPRVFRSDGPEPHDVTTLQLVCPDECPLVHDWAVVSRDENGGWWWGFEPGVRSPIPARWPLRLPVPHELREVLS